MKHRNPRRLISLVLAFVMVVGLLPAGFANAQETGVAAVNDAYEAPESLAPKGTAFTIDTLLAWTPESDPDAAYNRASIPLADRKGGFQVNPLANPEAKLMLCAYNDNPLAQGSESMRSYAFNYWQYVDSYIYWGGNGEEFIQGPTGEIIDAAHTNGVPIVGVLGFPWGSGYGYVEQVDAFCQKAADGSFPVADKLIEVMDYYGFDGWFFNQESYGCSAEIAARLNEMMRYMHAKRPDIVISWYDSMVESGGVSYQDAVNDTNKFWMTADENGNWGVDEFFMNYNWSASKVNTTINTMKSIGRSQYDAFAGFNMQSNVYGDQLRDHLLVDEDGVAKLSLALYYSNQTQTVAKDGVDFHKTEQGYYVGAAGDPRDTSVDVADSSVSTWPGMSRLFADKSPITTAPFVTSFNTGHGKYWFVDGEKLRDNEWSYQSNQDVLPTYTWIIDSNGEQKLEGSYDFEDAYNGGSSIRFSGTIDASNMIKLFSTNVEITEDMTVSMTAKGGLEDAYLVVYVGDENAESYMDCDRISCMFETTEGWGTAEALLGYYAGKTLYGIGLDIDGAQTDYEINVGRVDIIDKDRASVNGPKDLRLDAMEYTDPYTAEARIRWSKVTGATSYEIYKVHADGSKTFIMETPNTAYYIPNLTRDADETDVTIEVVPVNRNGVRGKASQLVIDWALTNDDGDRLVFSETVNVNLGATVTGYSEQGDGAECDKAIDGISGNGSKWWASGAGDWFSIDLGEPKAIKRIRVEHAEAGGEGKDLNTNTFTVYYKDTASNSWVQAYKKSGNTDAVTDDVLDTAITAQEWKLEINRIGPSPWSAVNIYEWQMFETGFPETEPVPVRYASAVNGAGAADTFTLKNVPASRTVKVYTAEGTLLGETTGSGTVTLTGLDFGTADAGRVFYTVTETGYGESVKFSVPFEAENAAKSEPAEDVTFVKYSQPGSVSSSNGADIYTTLTVNGLAEGDVVFVLGDEPVASIPVAAGETSVSIERVRVLRAGGELALQVKRAGSLISDVYYVDTPAFDEPTAIIQVFAKNENGETLTGVRFDVIDEAGDTATQMSTTSDSGAKATVELGTYTIRNTESPEGYGLAGDITAIVRIEGWENVYTVTVPTAGEEPDPTDPTDPDPTDPTDPVVDPADDSRDIPLEFLSVSAGDWQTGYEATEGPAELAVDNNPDTLWHTDWYGTSYADHWFQFELTADYNVDGLRYQPRQSGNSNGTITRYEIQVSDDGETFRTVASGNWEGDREWKLAQFDAERVKFVRLVSLEAVTDVAYVFASASEIRLTGEEYVEPAVPSNMALNAEIVAYNGNAMSDEAAGPQKLFDGTINNQDTSKWCEGGRNLWVAFDLGTAANVSNIKIYHAGANNEYTPTPGAINTEAYELYVLNTDKITVDELLAKSFEERTALLADNSYWTVLAEVTGNKDDITSHDVDLSDARIFKFNVSDTDSINSWGDCVRVYEVEVTGVPSGSGSGPVVTVDKSELRAFYDRVSGEKAGDYTPETWAEFAAALAAAEAVLADANADQTAVNNALTALQTAFNALERVQVEVQTQKILHLDSGRTYYSKDWTIALLNEMAAAGYTHLQLAFGNDGFRFVLDDMTIEANGKTYASDDVKAAIELGNEEYTKSHTENSGDSFCAGQTFAVHALTEAEMDEIIAHAQSVGIEIIPHLNMPGHMDALLDAMVELGISGAHFTGYTTSDRSLDLNNAEAVAFLQALLTKYAEYFSAKGSKYFHIGADEYGNDAYSGNMGFPSMGSTLYAKFAEFVNANAAIVEDNGMTARAWNDGIYYGSYTAEFDPDIEITYWSSGWWGYNLAKTSKFIEKGNGLINTHGDYYYILGVNDRFTPGNTAEHDPSLYTEAATYDITKFMDGSTVTDPVGGMFCIWGDHPFGETEQEVAANARLVLRAMALRMDGQSLDGMDTSVVEGGFNEDGTIAEGGETPDAADKTALTTLIGICEMYEKGNYTDESWNAFQAALEEARAVAADPNASQEQVNDIVVRLSRAMTGLTENEFVYFIFIGEVRNGTVTTDKVQANEGELITVTATPDEGYRLAAIYVNDIAIEGNTFQMPGRDVTVTAEFIISDVDDDAVRAAQAAAAAAEAAAEAAEEAQRKAEEAQAAADEAAASAAEDKEAAAAARQEAEEAQAAAEAAQKAAEDAQAAAEAAQTAAEAHDAAAAQAAAEAAKYAQEVAELNAQIAAMKAEMAEYLKDAQKAAEEAEEHNKAAAAAALSAAKYEALIELALAVDPDDYDAATAALIEEVINAGIEAINAAETIEAVREALEETLAQLESLTVKMPFVDVPADSFYAAPVLWAVKNGITTGTSETTFSPEKSITRAEAVTFLWRAAGEPEPTAAVSPFADVSEDDFFFKAVLWAVETGITTGLDQSHFGPYATANRAQVVTFLWRANGSPEASIENPFTDVADNAWFHDAVLWALETGVTTGVSATFFDAWGSCNRAQVVTFLYRAQ